MQRVTAYSLQTRRPHKKPDLPPWDNLGVYNPYHLLQLQLQLPIRSSSLPPYPFLRPTQACARHAIASPTDWKLSLKAARRMAAAPPQVRRLIECMTISTIDCDRQNHLQRCTPCTREPPCSFAPSFVRPARGCPSIHLSIYRIHSKMN